MHVVRRSLIAATALALTAGVVAVAPTPISALAPNEVVLPPEQSTSLPRVGPVLTTALGEAWMSNSTETQGYLSFRATGSAQVRQRKITVHGALTLVGSQVAFSNSSGASALDITTGTVTRLRGPYDNGDAFITGTGTGWLDRVYTPELQGENGDDEYSLRLTDATTKVSKTFASPTIGGRRASMELLEYATDQAGGVFLARLTNPGGSPQHSVAVYLDYATGTYRYLVTNPTSSFGGASVDQNHIAWRAGGKVHWVARQNMAATPSSAAYSGLVDVEVMNGKLAVTRRAGTGGAMVVESGPLGGPLTRVAGARPQGVLDVTTAGDFAVVAGTTTSTFGLYRLRAGETAYRGRLLAFGGAAPLGITASAGRLVTVSAADTARPARQRLVNVSGTTLSVGSATTLVRRLDGGVSPDSSGGHSVYLDRHKHGTDLVVQDGATVTARYEVDARSFRVTESGQRVLVEYSAGSEANDGAEVIDLATGVRTEVPARSTIWGTQVTYVKASGEVRLRDVVSGAERRLRAAGLPWGTSAGRGARVSSFGDWVMWTLPGVGNGLTQARNLRSGAVVTVPGPSRDLVDGVAAWIDEDDDSVHVYDLTARTDVVVGTAHAQTSEGAYLAMTDEFVAWVAGDATTHLLPLSAAAPATALRTAVAKRVASPTGTPRYLGAAGPHAFSPNGDKRQDAYRPRIDVSRPLTRWTFTVRTLKGKKVRVLRGSARSGAVRPVWNGRDSKGKKVKAGTYRWRVTGIGPAGELRRANGSTKAIVGTVRIDLSRPKAKVAAPASRKRADALKAFRVSWSSSQRFSSYRVTVARGKIRKDGTVAWAKPKLWRESRDRSARYGNGRTPYALKHRHAYRVTVVATDLAGNRSKAVSRTTRLR
jgi:hypothetical protein